jgi:hypothetical protein
MKGFSAPSGVIDVKLDKVTNRLATESCPQDYYVSFIAGTEPKQTCDQSFADHRGFFSKILGVGTPEVAPPVTTNGPVPGQPGAAPASQDAASAGNPNPATDQKKKKGFFSRVFGGKGSDKPQNGSPENSSPEKGNNPPPH